MHIRFRSPCRLSSPSMHELMADHLIDTRTGHNRLHSIVALSRQSIFGRLAGYEDVNDADYLAVDPVMRQIVGGRAVDHHAASASQMGRFETEVLATAENLAALADMPGHWIDRHHAAKPLRWITLDMDSSVSPTHGTQEGAAWNGHFDCSNRRSIVGRSPSARWRNPSRSSASCSNC